MILSFYYFFDFEDAVKKEQERFYPLLYQLLI